MLKDKTGIRRCSLNIIVWDIRATPDPLHALATLGAGGLFGFSGTFNYTIPAAGSPPSAYLPSGQLPFFLPYFIPEPGSLALISFGALALLAWRRIGVK